MRLEAWYGLKPLNQASISALREHVGPGMRISSLGVVFASLSHSDNELEGEGGVIGA